MEPPIERITVDSLRTVESLLPFLRDRVFHLTPKGNLESILKTRAVCHNGANRFPHASSMSENSYGRLRGWICLFDFRAVDDDVLTENRENYAWDDPFRPSVHPMQEFPDSWDDDTTAYLFLDEKAFPSLIPARNVVQEPMWRTLIREVECWWPGDLPLDFISSILVVSFDREREKEAHSRELDRIGRVLAEIFPHGFGKSERHAAPKRVGSTAKPAATGSYSTQLKKAP
jgi:hypothetical protein